MLPIPVINVEVSQKNNYLYKITTYSSVINERGCEEAVIRRIKGNKRIKSISHWRVAPDDSQYKQAVIEFERGR